MDLQDSSGHLRVNAIVTGRLKSAIAGLERVSRGNLETVRIDLSRENFSGSKQEIEQGIRQLSHGLSKASGLQVLALRLPAFDSSMERLRLGLNAWEALIRCLGEMAGHGKLRSLELSSITIKNSRATQDVIMSPCKDSCEEEAVSVLDPAPSSCGSSPRKLRRVVTCPTEGKGAAAAAATAVPKLSFLDALTRLSTLEELVLTHDEIFGNTAQLLPPVFQKLERLKRVDLTRNHISKAVMQELRESLPPAVSLEGDELQTFYFY